jgi:mannose-6-phosphate isomerase-like protein (cupin superfamily)
MTPVSLRVDEGEPITDRERRQLVILSSRPELTVTWSRHAPGEAGTNLHIHREHVDAFYVLEGELTFWLGAAGEPLSLRAGSFVAVPPLVVHAFRNESGADVSWLNFHAPDAGFAEYLRGDADFDNYEPPADGGRPREDAIVAVPLLDVEVPGLRVATGRDDGAELRYEHSDGRIIDMTARTG